LIKKEGKEEKGESPGGGRVTTKQKLPGLHDAVDLILCGLLLFFGPGCG
jgi:hypothetical protein